MSVLTDANREAALMCYGNDVAKLREALASALNAVANSDDTANALRAKLATALEKQAACIGHTADLVACRAALKLAARALAHYRDGLDPVLVAIHKALARGDSR